jgi:hypothetical protein
MPSTYELIKGETLASAVASYTFSAIPSTFTDLVLRCSVRISGTGGSVDAFYIYPNAVTTGTLYSNTRIQGEGTSVTSSRTSNSNAAFNASTTQDGATSNTFGSTEIYFPSYTAAINKPMSISDVAENNSATVNLVGAKAVLFRSTTAISSIRIDTDATFMIGSSFYLYGVKNA